jgi:hypothetical protein
MILKKQEGIRLFKDIVFSKITLDFLHNSIVEGCINPFKLFVKYGLLNVMGLAKHLSSTTDKNVIGLSYSRMSSAIRRALVRASIFDGGSVPT